MISKLESFISLVYPETPEVWRTDLAPIGKARAWVEADKKSPLPEYETKVDRLYRLTLFKLGGLTGPLNWYKAQVRNVDAEAINTIPPQNVVLTQPVLFVGGEKDYATRPEIMQQIAGQGKAQGWLPTVEVQVVPGASHWLQLEKHKEITAILVNVAKNLK